MKWPRLNSPKSSAAAVVRPSSPWHSYRLFFSQFRHNFTATGAIAPSGAALARVLTAPLARAAAGPRRLRVLEVGAGTGVFTNAILHHLGAGDRFEIYEINPAFRPLIEARIEAGGAPARGIDCHLRIAGIEDLDRHQPPGQDRYDFIISGLPLNNFSAEQVERILALLMAHLRSDGVLSYFEYPFLRSLKTAVVKNAAERRRLCAVAMVIERFLGSHRFEQVAVPLNLPPAVARHVHP